MAYTLWSVVYGEQPSAAKWNLLGSNDAYFNDQVGDDFSSGTTSTVWWEEIGRTTLSSVGDTITVSGLPSRRYLYVVYSGVASGGTLDTTWRFNNDSGTNYTYRALLNNVADTPVTSGTSFAGESGATDSGQLDAGTLEIVNITANEKMFMYRNVSQDAAGGGTVPTTLTYHGKWANTADSINRIDWINAGTGDFAAGSEVVVLGHD